MRNYVPVLDNFYGASYSSSVELGVPQMLERQTYSSRIGSPLRARAEMFLWLVKWWCAYTNMSLRINTTQFFIFNCHKVSASHWNKKSHCRTFTALIMRVT